MLERFARWFASTGGVWQTFYLVFALAVVETFFPNIDPQGFRLLYWLTVYSAVTQPALAYVARLAGERTDVALAEELNLIKEELQLIKEEREILQQIARAMGIE